MLDLGEGTVGRFSNGVAPVTYGVNGNPDAALFVEFYYRAEQNNYQSQVEGRPIFVSKPFVKIVLPGGKNIVEREVNETDKVRFPRQWNAFVERKEAPITGLPVEQWPALSVEQVAVLKALSIYTVEQLVAIPETIYPQIGMDARSLVAKAKAFLDAAKGAAPMQALAAENAALKNEIEMLKAQFRTHLQNQDVFDQGNVEEAQSSLDAPQIKRPRGRPRKTTPVTE